MSSHASEHLLAGYVRYLTRGATTHASYGQVASEQAVDLQKVVDGMAANQQTDAEDGIERQDSDVQIVANRVELLNLQASIHTLGLSVCLVGLALIQAGGHDVPAAPPLPEEVER